MALNNLNTSIWNGPKVTPTTPVGTAQIKPKEWDFGECWLYISHLDDLSITDPNEKEKIKYWRLPCWPDAISDRMGSTFGQTTALGRTAPVYTYSNSGPRTVQISLTLHRDIINDDNYEWSNSQLQYDEDYVDNLINALRAIALPKYNLQNKSIEPPIVALRLGTEIFIKGIVTGEIGLTFGKPILKNGKYATVELSLDITEIDPYDSTSVYKNGGFRGVVSTMKDYMHIND